MDYDVCKWHSDLSMDEREDSGIVRMAKADGFLNTWGQLSKPIRACGREVKKSTEAGR